MIGSRLRRLSAITLLLGGFLVNRQEGILKQLLLRQLFQFDRIELQQLDRLLHLRRHDQPLGLLLDLLKVKRHADAVCILRFMNHQATVRCQPATATPLRRGKRSGYLIHLSLESILKGDGGQVFF